MTVGRITLYVATSVDGYIADVEGGVDWLEGFDTGADDDETVETFEAFFRGVDCLVMGATTYERVLGFGEWPYGDRPTYVFSHGAHPSTTDAVTFVDGSVTEQATRLREQYDDIWLVGGAMLCQAFFRERQVDALRLALVPVLLGDGIPLFAGGYERQRLRLVDTGVHDSGIVEQQYEVDGGNGRP